MDNFLKKNNCSYKSDMFWNVDGQFLDFRKIFDKSENRFDFINRTSKILLNYRLMSSSDWMFSFDFVLVWYFSTNDLIFSPFVIFVRFLQKIIWQQNYYDNYYYVVYQIAKVDKHIFGVKCVLFSRQNDLKLKLLY